jgi:hypothetical protein
MEQHFTSVKDVGFSDDPNPRFRRTMEVRGRKYLLIDSLTQQRTAMLLLMGLVATLNLDSSLYMMVCSKLFDLFLFVRSWWKKCCRSRGKESTSCKRSPKIFAFSLLIEFVARTEKY